MPEQLNFEFNKGEQEDSVKKVEDAEDAKVDKKPYPTYDEELSKIRERVKKSGKPIWKPLGPNDVKEPNKKYRHE